METENLHDKNLQDKDTRSTSSDSGSASTARGLRRSRGRRRWLLMLAVPLAVGLAGLSVARAQHFGGQVHGGKGAFMKERIDHLLSAAGASDAQKGQIQTIWDGLRPHLKALHQQHAAARRQIGEAMTAPKIDPGQVENLRQQSVAIMDKISAVITQGMVASAQVLTPEQRKVVLQKIEEHRHHDRDAGE